MWLLLIQFIFRMTFGVALAMGITPARWVTSGFYRVHLWVLLGLNTFAALAIYSQGASLADDLRDPPLLLALTIFLALCCYIGSIVWLYERPQWGTPLLYVVAVAAVVASLLATSWADAPAAATVLVILDLLSSGWLLGVTLSAMFLGHWYLNTPTMELLPLRRLVVLMAIALLARAAVSATGILLQASGFDVMFWIFITLRWLSGLLATLLLTGMTWYALRVPNTQSATGILYAAVILTFIGELTSQLLSVDTRYPL